MSTKIIVSYDGTANEEDAVALGQLLGRAGGEVSLAYVRHNPETDSAREQIAHREAESVLHHGVELLGIPTAERHVIIDRSTPHGLAALAEREGADVIVFCSDSHTAQGHVAVGNSAQRLLEGGRTAVAVASVGLAERLEHGGVEKIVAVGAAEGGARESAQALAKGLGATVAPVVNNEVDMIVIDSRADASQGRVSLSSSAEHLIETATAPVLVVARGVALTFDDLSAVTAV
ncbi:MAG: universal stress protein [Solirubrobacteraceae bacterium]